MDEFEKSLNYLEQITGKKIDQEHLREELERRERRDSSTEHLDPETWADTMLDQMQRLETIYGAAAWQWLEYLVDLMKGAKTP